MALVVLASAAGSPGTTTTSLGATLLWPRDALLADCDRQPAQAIEAGYLQGVDASGAGLPRVVQAHREGQPLEDVLLGSSLPLTDQQNPRRLFLPGFPHPGSPALFLPVWPELAAAFQHLGRVGIDVLADAGRVGAGLPGPLLAAADLVVVCVRSSLRSLAGLRLSLPVVRDDVASQGGRAEVGVIVVGPGRPYGAREIADQFGVAVLAEIAYDPTAAAVLSDGEPRSRRFDAGPFSRSMRAAASGLAERTARRHSRIAGRHDGRAGAAAGVARRP